MGVIRKRAAIATCVLGVVIAAMSWSHPATAHLGTPAHLWRAHLRPLADARYMQNTHIFVSTPFTLNGLADLTVTRSCPAGSQVLGGGVDFETANANVQVVSSSPLVNGANLFTVPAGKSSAGDGWRVTMHNAGALDVPGKVGAICSS